MHVELPINGGLDTEHFRKYCGDPTFISLLLRMLPLGLQILYITKCFLQNASPFNIARPHLTIMHFPVKVYI